MIRTNDDNDYESWLLPFADMVTFLMAFFVILYSVNQTSPEQAQRITEAIAVSMDPDAVFDPNASKRPPTIQEKYELITSDIEMAMQEINLDEAVSIHLSPDGLMLTAKTELLFSSGSDQLKPDAINVIQNIALIVKNEPIDIRVEGHTDDLPINTARFPSNWELSSSRAIAVLKQLQAANIWPSRLSATGYADTRPLVNASGTPEEVRQARETNRRVVFVLARNDL